ncbi:tRNA nucleotidyltransferase cca2-like isoform X3 [Rosa rugosa]|uniref:tRNA nucleotidyltransferase cca2-like isoform X3 n=1 Tax=Rosa rugosa TaxID=74645 RepID=UPI002B41342D|nr:tRNA nucleotidyltransferase cca2-like isoform X3 [Rosa rugosa]
MVQLQFHSFISQFCFWVSQVSPSMAFLFSHRALLLQKVLPFHPFPQGARLKATYSLGFPFRLPPKSYTTRQKGTLQGTRLSGSEGATMVMSTPTVHVRDTIELDETEEKIFERLLGTLDHYGLKTELRVAGGWVRDKLLGKECKDIDIALEDMMGSKFVEKVRDYLLSVGEEVQGIAIIPSNPDQSKHLETARMRILNVWVDFVNLRCEEYSDDSRIPTMQKYGTPEQDALRRDLTINSLFYNINTKSIEDWTNRGVEDLKCGKIASPLPPKDTFMEDPLRVLRAIRFGARFGFILDEQLKEAAACDEVKAALSAKISRERIGAEVSSCLAYLSLIVVLQFTGNLSFQSLHPQCEPSEGCDSDCVAYLDCTWNLIQLVGHSTFNDEQRRLSFYAAMFLPLRKTMYKDRKAKDVPVVNYIFRDSLKQRVSDAETVINLHNALEKFLSLLPHFVPNEDVKLAEVDLGREYVDVPLTSKESKLRVLTGFLLREIKDFWRVALLMSTLLYPTNVLDKNLKPEDRRALFVEAERAINNLGLDKVWDVKPLLNGKEIMDALQLKSGGPLVSKWQRKLLAWQLAHPLGTAEECLKWLKETHSSSTRSAGDMEELNGPNNKKSKTEDCD